MWLFRKLHVGFCFVTIEPYLVSIAQGIWILHMAFGAGPSLDLHGTCLHRQHFKLKQKPSLVTKTQTSSRLCKGLWECLQIWCVDKSRKSSSFSLLSRSTWKEWINSLAAPSEGYRKGLFVSAQAKWETKDLDLASSAAWQSRPNAWISKRPLDGQLRHLTALW